MGASVAVSIPEFLALSPEAILGRLTAPVSTRSVTVQYRQQIDAWRTEIDLLRATCQRVLDARAEARTWAVLLEFEIPRRQRRPDVVLLAGTVLFVIEFKVGAARFDRSAIWQVEDYALDLHEFHAASGGSPIVPILVATNASASHRPQVTLTPTVAPVQCLRVSDLAEAILSIAPRHPQTEAPLRLEEWVNSAYRPVLSVIEAAERLFAQHSVREISHAYADNLGETCDAVVQAVRDAQTNKSRTVCFVTGVPGSGKTLAGLSAVHDPELRKEGRACGVFLSGNVPLVRILCEALARDRARGESSLAESRRKVRTFVQSVHTFIKEYGIEKPHQRPYENVIVFDEAQRAWDAQQVALKHDIEKSEAQLVLEIMSRCEGWSVIVALIGEGQEIHKGEAGLAEWMRAIQAQSGSWQVVASPHTRVQHGQALFVAESDPIEVTWRASLHLEVSVRSPRAKNLHEWVDRVLSRRPEEAAAIMREITAYPVVLTREIEEARQWLRDRSRRDRRCGLVSSSRSLRHRAYGLELSSGFRHGYSFEDWFLRGPEDVRSSFQLEVAASQFECQGLELDWVGLCWGGDLCIDPMTGEWVARHFVGDRWQRVGREEAIANLFNTYRVLMTRAREGLVLWIPPGSPSDPSLDPAPLTATAEFLKRAGVRAIEGPSCV